MGFASNIVIGSTAFLLGMVFMCQVVDIPLLYIPVTREAIDNAYAFYEMWYEAPGAVKLHKWNESAKFFDGSAIALQLAVVVLYLSVHIQSLRTFLPDAKSTWTLLPQPPPLTEPITEDDKIEAVRVLAAGNALVGILLIGVLGMQIGQEYAGNMEALEQKAIDEAARSASELKVEDKKNI
ncbi:hypothetical protein A1Q1_04649 [Trichosporon asahii var. asahii CBS 2479]|uniref:ER membrane protein SH3 n=1 Tax=Trichosporon asahii var. asahii (strain ATCC 90039 / CBS 2479 / JCM 2466 / KCTC 7840 / NBRC 103889/ NCYC 2677 / UAMH 7654) TaxID=1186058 RepID=J6EQD4_TRIAS|nr:hypothetical protein A1Q1_04649 [Trichosporon asahii var. asahii CBS 2479]EJT46684.1 hypothetical protein A1Q1_04649 [Trichosporon asahii var. asahii CBS 2479]